MDTTVANTFTTTSQYTFITDVLQKTVDNSFSVSSKYQQQTVATGTFSANTFSTFGVYGFERKGFDERLLRVKRATSGDVDKRSAFSTLVKRLSLIQGIKSLRGSVGACGSIKACVSLKRKTARVVNIRRNSAPFISQAQYKSVATFSATLSEQVFREKEIINTFTTQPFYNYDVVQAGKVVTNTFSTTSLYNTIVIEPKNVVSTFSTTPVYKYAEEIPLDVANTFTSVSKFDLFTQSGIAKTDTTFSTTSNYSLETISIFLGVGKSFAVNSNYSLKTFFEERQTSNSFTTVSKYALDTISEFIQTSNNFSATVDYSFDTISTFKETQASFSSNSSYSLQTIADTTQVSNTFVITSQYNATAITKLQYLTTATFTPTVNSAVFRTEILQPQSSLNNNGWLSANQGIMTEDIGGTTPDDSTGISHFSVSSSDRSISFDYGTNNLSFLEQRDNHTLKVRYYASSGLGSINLTVDIISGGVTRRTQTYNNIGQSIVQRDIVLTRTQANNINYDDVQMRLTAFTTDGSDKEITVTWGVFEIPEVL